MPIVILGHRGMGPTSRVYVNSFLPPDVLPENTLAAFQVAIDNGAQGIELDVYTTRDDVVVVSREDILDRNVDGFHSCWNAKDIPILGRISETNFADLQNSKYSLGYGQFIPSLRSVIDLIIENNKRLSPNKIKINIELQGDNLSSATKTWAIIHEYVTNKQNNLDLNDFVVNSFNIKQLISFRAAQQDKPVQSDTTVDLMLGVYTAALFGNEELLPGWVPVVRTDGQIALDEHGAPIPKAKVDENYLRALIATAQLHQIKYLDLISADLRTNLLQICAQHGMDLSMACNLVRARAEYDLWFKRSNLSPITDAELEQIQLQELFRFSTQFQDRTFYYKADNVMQTLRFLKSLEANFTIASLETEVAPLFSFVPIAHLPAISAIDADFTKGANMSLGRL